VVPPGPSASLPGNVPLHLHARYRTEEIAAAFDLLLITLDKAAKK
jgi:hypothetical protein